MYQQQNRRVGQTGLSRNNRKIRTTASRKEAVEAIELGRGADREGVCLLRPLHRSFCGLYGRNKQEVYVSVVV